MKLVQKTTRYIFLAILPIALGGVFLLDYFIHQTISNEIDELLLNEFEQVKQKLRQHPPNATDLRNWDHNLQIAIAANASTASPVLTDSTVVDPLDNKVVPVRMLLATYAVKQHYYVITLHQPYLEFDEIAHILSMGIIICFLALIAFLLLFEAAILLRIWRPFYTIIDQLKKYRIDQSEPVTFPISDIDEFALLGQSLEEMTRRAGYQYSQQKQFADNASHELQTPLSILSFELDLLQQSSWALTEADLNRIQRSQQTIKRLSSMNQSLLLLTKIDNQQFIQNESINISELTNQLIENYTDYAAHKGMVLNRLITDGPNRTMNRQLAFILFSNLIKNAIRHGSPNTSILIQVTIHSFIITNQGDPLPFPEEEIFQRFVRNHALPQSTGLGLALVKEIANLYGMTVQYTYAAQIRRHIVEVSFD